MTLAGLLLKRVAALAAVLVVVSLVTFAIAYVIPGDPAQMISGPRASATQVEAVRHRLGLDRPLPVQYAEYLDRLAHGDLGVSMVTGRPVSSELISRAPATVELMASALMLSVTCGIALGVLAALRRGTLWDHLIRFLSLCGNSWPTFCSGLVLLLVFYARLGWLPPGGRLDPAIGVAPHITGFLLLDGLLTGRPRIAADALIHLILPVLTLAFASVGVYVRLARASMLEVLSEDYIRTAVANGLRKRTVVLHHALRNALIPLVTVFGIEIGHLLFGSVIVETLFAWPGIGRFALAAITELDFPVIMGFTVLTSMAYVTVNMAVDLAYVWIDPRLRDSASR